MAEYGDGQQYIPVNEQEEIEKEENRKYQVWQEGEDAKKAAEEQKIKQAEGFIEPEFRKLLCYGPQGIACATHYSKQTQANNYKPRQTEGDFNVFKSGSIYRQPENLSINAQFWLKKQPTTTDTETTPTTTDTETTTKKKSWRDIKKGGPGDFSWGGYEDQKKKERSK